MVQYVVFQFPVYFICDGTFMTNLHFKINNGIVKKKALKWNNEVCHSLGKCNFQLLKSLKIVNWFSLHHAPLNLPCIRHC